MTWILPTPAGDAEGAQAARPASIHFPRSVAQDIESKVSSEMKNPFRSAEVKVCGVLFGTHSESALLIGAQVPAPSFTPSETSGAIKSVLDAAAKNPDLAGYEPVGWYASRAGGELCPSTDEIEFFKQVFPDRWQVILALQPNSMMAIRAQFFCPAANGSTPAPISAEFTITRSPQRRGRTGRPLGNRARHSRIWDFRSISIGVMICASLGLLFWAVAFRLSGIRNHPRVSTVTSGKRFTRSFGFDLSDSNGQLQINWDHTATPLLDARWGVLHIDSAISSNRYLLSGDELRQGIFLYIHSSPLGTTRVRLEIYQGDGGTAVQSALLVGMPSLSTPFSPFSSPADNLSRTYRELKELVSEAAPVETTSVTVQPPLRDQVLPPEDVRATKVQLKPFVPPIRLEESSTAFPAIQPPLINVANNAIPPALISDPVLPQALPQQPSTLRIAPSATPLKSGTIVWTGNLAKRGVLDIEGTRASTGYLNRALPGIPLRIEAYRGEFASDGLIAYTADPQSARGVLESAGPDNGWNTIRYTFDPKTAKDLSILEPPNVQTGWVHLTLRSEWRDHSVIIIRWHVP